MTKERTAQAITLGFIALVVAFVALRQSGWSPSTGNRQQERSPQDTIYSMLDAAREGDVDAYIGHYQGQLRASLERAIEEQGAGGFAEYLRQSNAPIKGIAVTAPERLSPNSVKARVEYVFADRNEVQFMFLENAGGEWVITRVDAAQRIKTLVPYWTPVE
jgi:hypothetical protein